MENTFKMCKQTKRKTILHKAKEPKGEKAYYWAKSRPKHMENKAKTKESHLQSESNTHRPTPEDQRRSPDQIGVKVTQLGCGHNPVGMPQAQPSTCGAIMAVEGGALGISSVIFLQTNQQAAIKGGGGLPTHTHHKGSPHSLCQDVKVI